MKVATYLIALFSLALVSCSGEAPLQSTAIPQSDVPLSAPAAPCDPVMGEGQTLGTPGGFVGSADLTIRGELHSAQVTTILLGPPRETGDGTLLADTSHTFDLGAEGSFVTLDKARLEPTSVPGVFQLNSTMKVTQGADRGNLTAHGTINLIPGQEQADFEIHGSLCGFGD